MAMVWHFTDMMHFSLKEDQEHYTSTGAPLLETAALKAKRREIYQLMVVLNIPSAVSKPQASLFLNRPST
jgi:hypothetical protein